jgi:hypothetical protein
MLLKITMRVAVTTGDAVLDFKVDYTCISLSFLRIYYRRTCFSQGDDLRKILQEVGRAYCGFSNQNPCCASMLGIPDLTFRVRYMDAVPQCSGYDAGA